MRRLWVVVFAGCVHHGAPQTGSAGFSVSYPDAHGATVKQGARFYAKPEAKCFYDNGREARWTIGGAHVASGELPPGLTLEDGVIGGVAKRAVLVDDGSRTLDGLRHILVVGVARIQQIPARYDPDQQ